MYRLIRICGGATLKLNDVLALFFKLSNFCIIAVFSNVSDNSACDSEPPAAVRFHYPQVQTGRLSE